MARKPSHLFGIETYRGQRGVKYRGVVYDRQARKQRRSPWTESLAEARSARLRLLNDVENQALGDTQISLQEAVDAFLER